MGKTSRRKPDLNLIPADPHPFLAGMSEPLDPETFKMMVEVYQAAASMAMPTPNPELNRFQFGPDGGVFSLSDNSLNRGMLAVTRQCRELGIQNPQAYASRIMHLDEIFEFKDRFGDLIAVEDDGSLKISDNVLDAAAVAKFYADRDRMGFDLDDVVQRALELEAAERAAEGEEDLSND